VPEERCSSECRETAPAYDHPGVLITVAAGDEGYLEDYGEFGGSPSYPAVLPSVVAVGGTTLTKAANTRGWSEEVWSEPQRGLGTGGGCPRGNIDTEKPAWQTDPGCPFRTGNDVAAVAACETPVSVYVSLHGGWKDICGTSASTPLVAGAEAHATAYARSLPGAEAFYEDPEVLFDVTAGGNGICPTTPPGAEYLCQAEVGYDGPTGMGTPDGPLELAGP
jgi:Subtilase family